MEAGRLEREPAIVAWNGDGLDKSPAAAPVELIAIFVDAQAL